MSLEFGTLVLSKKASLRVKVLKTGMLSYYDVVYLCVGKFIFQRPDNKQILIEMPEGIIQETAEDVYLYNPANIEHFKELVRDMFQDRVIRILDQSIQVELDAAKECQEKVLSLQKEILLLEEKNAVEYSSNRNKQIKGLSKNLRKHERKLVAVESFVSRERERIAKIEKEQELSLASFYETIELPK